MNIPPGLNAGKIENLERLAKELGISDGELALMKVNALITVQDLSEDRIKKLLGHQYKPNCVGEFVDCLVHRDLRQKMEDVVDGINDALLK